MNHLIKYFLKCSVLITFVSLAFNAQAYQTERYKFINEQGLNFGTKLVINATPEQIWEVLTDTASYSEWNAFTPRVETSFEVGSPIILYVRLFRLLPDALLEQPETVSAFDVNDKMCWVSFQLSVEAFNSNRCIVIETNEEGETVLLNTMVYSGYLWPFIGTVSKTSVYDGFTDLSIGLKDYIENP